VSALSLIAILLCFASVFGVINERALGLPPSIGLLIVTLLASFCVIGLDALFPGLALKIRAQEILGVGGLPDFLLNGALSFLLFAGALQVDLSALWSRKFTVSLLATVGVAIATVMFGLGVWLIFRLIGINTPLLWCLVLGAVLAPTDPVAISGIVGRLGLPKQMAAVLAGESLFNDGVAIVMFKVMLVLATSQQAPSSDAVVVEFAREIGLGLIIGGATGAIAYQMIRPLDQYGLEIMISLALAAGTFSLANALGASGPIAVAVSGLLIGGRATRYIMSETTRRNLRLFWSVIDDILNAVLFLLLGFEVLGLTFNLDAVACAILSIPLAIAVRGLSVIVPVFWLHYRNPNVWRGAAVLTWGGLRGGISVALALSIPQSTWRNDILLICYTVVVFTIIVQGLTLNRVIRRLAPSTPAQHGL